jgi:hypothetical protein
MWHYNTQQHRMVRDVPYPLVFGQHPHVGIAGLYLEQDLLDRLATKVDLNRVVEYEGIKAVLDDNDPNDAREKEGVAEMEEGEEENEEVHTVLEPPADPLPIGKKEGVLETEDGVAENEEVDAVLEFLAYTLPVGPQGDAVEKEIMSSPTKDGVLEPAEFDKAMVVGEQGVPSTPCGKKTTGDVGFTEWQVMMFDLGNTIIDCNYLQNMPIRQSIPVAWCLDPKKVLDTQSFVSATLVKISKTTWELINKNDDKMDQLFWDGNKGVNNLFGIYIKQPD